MKDEFPLCEITWVDATHCDHGTHSLEEALAHSGAMARTVGYLLGQDKEYVKLCMTCFYDTDLPKTEDKEQGFRLIWVIPRGCIQKINILRSK